MSVLSLSCSESDVYWRQNNKHFAELAPQNGGKQLTWRNYATVTLCVILLFIVACWTASLSQTFTAQRHKYECNLHIYACWSRADTLPPLLHWAIVHNSTVIIVLRVFNLKLQVYSCDKFHSNSSGVFHRYCKTEGDVFSEHMYLACSIHPRSLTGLRSTGDRWTICSQCTSVTDGQTDRHAAVYITRQITY